MSQSNELRVVKLDPPERERTYHYANGDSWTYKDVRQVSISPSGSHRLLLGNGKTHIPRPNWIDIELDVDALTF